MAVLVVSGNRRFGAAFRRPKAAATIDPLAQAIADGEARHPLGRHRDNGAGFGIAPGTSPPLLDRKGAKAADLDAVPGRQRRSMQLHALFPSSYENQFS